MPSANGRSLRSPDGWSRRIALKTYGPPRLQGVLSRSAADQSASTYPAPEVFSRPRWRYARPGPALSHQALLLTYTYLRGETGLNESNRLANRLQPSKRPFLARRDSAPPTHDCAVVELKHTRAPLALRASKKAPAAAVWKFAVRDADFSLYRVVAFAENDNCRFRVAIYDAQGPEPANARRCRHRVLKLKTPVLAFRDPLDHNHHNEQQAIAGSA